MKVRYLTDKTKFFLGRPVAKLCISSEKKNSENILSENGDTPRVTLCLDSKIDPSNKRDIMPNFIAAWSLVTVWTLDFILSNCRESSCK